METSAKRYDSLRESPLEGATDPSRSYGNNLIWNCSGSTLNCLFTSPNYSVSMSPFSPRMSSLPHPLHDIKEPTPTGFLLESNGYDAVINGFLMPLLAAITLVTNCLVVAVLLRRHMRTPTNTLLVALATSDTLTSISPVPVWIRFYAGGTRPDDEWVPYHWCFAYYLLTDYMPSMFHTASVWLTMAVAGQRYLRVCRPPNSLARRLVCSMAGAGRISIAVFAVAVASHLFRLAEMTYHPIDLPSRLDQVAEAVEDENASATTSTTSVTSFTDDVFRANVVNGRTLVSGCRVELSQFVNDHENAYFSIYFWTRVLLVHLIPCFLLIAFNVRLIKTMMDASRRRRMRRQPRLNIAADNLTDAVVEAGLTNEVSPIPMTSIGLTNISKRGSSDRATLSPFITKQPPAVSSPSTAMPAGNAAAPSPCRPRVAGHAGHGPGSTRATVMLMTVVGVFLVVEIPLVVIFVMVIVENTVGVDLYSDDARHTAALFVNLFITVSYPANFFVYCSMSREFRRTFAAMFTRHC